MEQTVCMTYFAITGKFDPVEISAILGIKNTGGHSLGDKKRYGSGYYDWSSWQFGTNYIETLDAIEQVEKIIDILTSKIDKLIFIKKHYKCQFIFMQVPKVEKGNTPAIGFSKKVIEFCYKTGTEIEIDLYVNPYNSETDIN